MTLSDVKDILSAKVYSCEDKLDRTVIMACGADLMSDVLAFAKEKGVLLTGLVNPQVIRTAEMLDIKAVVFVRGKVPTDEIIALGEERQLVLMSTEIPMYIACGKLYTGGLNDGGASDEASL